MSSTRRLITFTEEFDKAVADYQRQHNLSSWSQAVVTLAAQALNFEGEAQAQRGGWQGNERSLENLIHYVDRVTDHGRNDPKESDVP